jgi:hypothetical protein
MTNASPLDPVLHFAATCLVILSAMGGVFGCALGSVTFGLSGLVLALVGSWCLFVVGLAGLYQREQRLQQLVQVAPAVTAPIGHSTANLS